MNFDDMNELQRRLHNAAIVAECDGDEYGHAGVMRDAIVEIARLRQKEFFRDLHDVCVEAVPNVK